MHISLIPLFSLIFKSEDVKCNMTSHENISYYFYEKRYTFRQSLMKTFSALSLTLILSSGEDIAHRQVNQPKIKERSRNSVAVVHGGWQFT